jgi:hypothetical protein
MVCYSVPVDVVHSVLCWGSDCESWWAMLRKFLWSMVCYAESLIMNYGVLCWASGCESLWDMLNQWMWIMVSYAEIDVVNHDEVCLASVCKSSGWWDLPSHTHNQVYLILRSGEFFSWNWFVTHKGINWNTEIEVTWFVCYLQVVIINNIKTTTLISVFITFY